MTPGLGELYYFPKETVRSIEDGRKISALTFWYDSQSRYLAHYQGDIIAPPEKNGTD